MAARLDLYNLTDKYVTMESAERVRRARVADDMAANPKFNASENQMIGSPGTTALYLAVLWDEAAGATHKTWIRVFFGKTWRSIKLRML